MNPKESRTPQAASDIKLPRPRKIFVLPGTLVTVDLYTDNGSGNDEGLDDEYQHKEQTAPHRCLQNLSLQYFRHQRMPQSRFLLMSEAPHFIKATTEKWIEFDSHHQAYNHIGGTKPVIKLTDKDNLEYIAEYILDGTVGDLVVTRDEVAIRQNFRKPIWKNTQALAEMPSECVHPSS